LTYPLLLLSQGDANTSGDARTLMDNLSRMCSLKFNDLPPFASNLASSPPALAHQQHQQQQQQQVVKLEAG